MRSGGYLRCRVFEQNSKLAYFLKYSGTTYPTIVLQRGDLLGEKEDSKV